MTNTASPAALWHELVAAATVGLDRTATPPAPAGPLAELLAHLPADDREGALLAAAAATMLVLRAGRLPELAAAPALLPAPPDGEAICPPAAAARLAALLSGSYQGLVGEWLDAVAERDLVAPPESLAALLEYGRRHEELRVSIGRVLGARGAWLAGLNREWHYAKPDAADLDNLTATWETGTRDERLALLQALRASDPARARSLLEAAWREEKAAERTAFVATLATGLCLEDESFLEAALDDRSKEVRRRAAELLARLPDSRLAQRMAARALALVRWTPAKRGVLGVLGSPARIAVALPEACDEAMVRDGIEPSPPSGVGERAWWLMQLVQHTAPGVWERAWNATPDEIVQAEIEKEWRGVLRRGWLATAERHTALPWIEALLAHAAEVASERPARRATSSDEGMLSVESLVLLLSRDRHEALIADLLRRNATPFGGMHPALAMLRRAGGPWGHDLSQAVIGALARRLARFDEAARADYHLRAAMDSIGRSVAPELTEAAIAAVPPDVRATPYWGSAFEDYIGTLEFRRDMLRELDRSSRSMRRNDPMVSP
jgi:hypothetical protein